MFESFLIWNFHRFQRTIERTFSVPLFVQFIVSGIILCITSFQIAMVSTGNMGTAMLNCLRCKFLREFLLDKTFRRSCQPDFLPEFHRGHNIGNIFTLLLWHGKYHQK